MKLKQLRSNLWLDQCCNATHRCAGGSCWCCTATSLTTHCSKQFGNINITVWLLEASRRSIVPRIWQFNHFVTETFLRKIQIILERIGIRQFVGAAKIRVQYLSAVRNWKSWFLTLNNNKPKWEKTLLFIWILLQNLCIVGTSSKSRLLWLPLSQVVAGTCDICRWLARRRKWSPLLCADASVRPGIY